MQFSPVQSSSPARHRVPLVAVGMVALLSALWAGVARIGWGLPLPRADFALMHGTLMVGGFLGTVICLERAVAMRSWWGYIAPLLTAVGVIAMLAGAVADRLLVLAGSIMLLIMFGRFLLQTPNLSTSVMAIAVFLWVVGNVGWVMDQPLFEVVHWWMGFLVLTIVGERLLLSQIVSRSAVSSFFFRGGVAAVCAGLVVFSASPETGTRIAGIGMIVLAWWIWRFDIARRTVRQEGLTRFVAFALLSGAAWLAVGGVLFAVHGFQAAGAIYDAGLHAVMVGFVFAMIFGHAPLVFPAILNVKMAYSPTAYVPLILLHASLLLRVAGDLAGWLDGRRIGGLVNAVAILLFLANTAVSVASARKAANP